jgi:hypothetical protein
LNLVVALDELQPQQDADIVSACVLAQATLAG